MNFRYISHFRIVFKVTVEFEDGILRPAYGIYIYIQYSS